jgi:hypothetical protein
MLYREPQPSAPGNSKRVIQSNSATGAQGARVPLAGQSLAYALPRALVLLLLACLLIQGTAVQTHVHFVAQARSAAADASAHAAKPDKGDAAGDCPLCQEMAMAGAYLLPQAIVLPPPPASFLGAGAATIAEFGLHTPALGWLSRAPPQ